MTDLYAGIEPPLGGPADRIFAITPSNDADLAYVTTGLWVGTGGALVVVDRYGTETTIPNVPPGTCLPIRVRRVKATGTTASGLVGFA